MVERAGGVLERWEALQQNKQAGTMLVTPFDIIAKAAGLNVLDCAIDVYGHYQGLVGATRRAWAAENPTPLEFYVRGYVAALAFLYGTGNRDENVAIVRKNPPHMPADLAAPCLPPR